ncbi:hypothetical protein J3F84DRAFT_131101 [Trichoderma pleuroticola]
MLAFWRPSLVRRLVGRTFSSRWSSPHAASIRTSIMQPSHPCMGSHAHHTISARHCRFVSPLQPVTAIHSARPEPWSGRGEATDYLFSSPLRALLAIKSRPRGRRGTAARRWLMEGIPASWRRGF